MGSFKSFSTVKKKYTDQCKSEYFETCGKSAYEYYHDFTKKSRKREKSQKVFRKIVGNIGQGNQTLKKIKKGQKKTQKYLIRSKASI